MMFRSLMLSAAMVACVPAVAMAASSVDRAKGMPPAYSGVDNAKGAAPVPAPAPEHYEPVAAPMHPFGFYAGAEGGATWAEDADLDGTGLGAKLDYEPGWNAGAVVGYAFGTGLRTEIEGFYNENNIDKLHTDFGKINAEGEVKNAAAMLNVYYDIYMGDSPFVPFVGGGVGASYVDLDIDTPVGGESDHSWEFAYQGIVGVGYELTDNMVLDASYRYFATSDADLAGDTSLENHNHKAVVGLKYFFGPNGW